MSLALLAGSVWYLQLEQVLAAALPVQVLRLGPGVIGTMPCEVFAEIGLEFARRAAGRPRIADNRRFRSRSRDCLCTGP